jgi:D-alanyl-D-alanine dipeptidase
MQSLRSVAWITPLIAFAVACSGSSASSPASDRSDHADNDAGPDDGGAPSPPAAEDAGPGTSTSPIPTTTTQLIVVVSADWTSVPATLQRFERTASTAWTQTGTAEAVVLGKTGLGWGLGLHPAPAPTGEGPIKKEGDGRSPAGVFTLGSAFGYAAPADATWLRLPYMQATTDLECVDDPGSAHYNTLVHRSSVASPDWNSSETMLRPDTLYRWGLFVNHNAPSPQPGAGSCIFFHIWSGPSSSTIGCTADDETRLKAVLAWLDPARNPVIVQLPRAVYSSHQIDWALP